MSRTFSLHHPQPGRRGYVILKTEDPGSYVLLRECHYCGQDSRVKIPAQGLWDWEHGEFVQVAFSGLSADEREQVMTGTHPSCWDALEQLDEELPTIESGGDVLVQAAAFLKTLAIEFPEGPNGY